MKWVIATVKRDVHAKSQFQRSTFKFTWVKKIITTFGEFPECNYRKTSNIDRTLVGNKIVDNSDVVGASPAGAAPTTSSFST